MDRRELPGLGASIGALAATAATARVASSDVQSVPPGPYSRCFHE